MTETLLSPSNVLLFGRKVEDLEIVVPNSLRPPIKVDFVVRLISLTRVDPDAPGTHIDGRPLKDENRVLLAGQTDNIGNGIYQYKAARNGDPATLQRVSDDLPLGTTIRVRGGRVYKGTIWESQGVDGGESSPVKFDPIEPTIRNPTHNPFRFGRLGMPGQTQGQLTHADACFARIYGFSYAGTYYDLPSPVLFLVHGEGNKASEYRTGTRARANRARALGDPSLMGLGAADFEFADDLRVWSYDKADYTIRMDVETGMFEDILLSPFFSGDGGGGVSGARVSGARVSGARVSGARVSGARVSGARLSGGRGDASD